ncbi:MAG: InlB B-repeat-containing protein, partial [Alphaproteobacteria bacterium]|nr:InlB B-repeat-containing protein [Alphaproteobacteria bacterium]
LYKKTDLTQWYSNNTCSTAVTTTPAPSKTNATFSGYYTASDNTTTSVGSNATPSVLSTTWTVNAPTTVYAHYNCNANYNQGGTDIAGVCNANTYTVTYACGTGATGDAPADDTATYNAAFNAAANTCEKTGYTFAGWLPDGANSNWVNGTTWTYTTNKTFTAQWTANCNAVTLNTNGGTAGSIATLYKITDDTRWFSDNTCTTEYTATTDVIPTRSGYTFRGFHGQVVRDVNIDTAANILQYITTIGAISTSGATWTVNAPTTIYAAWAKNCATVSHGSCSLNVSENGAVDYRTVCNLGYTIIKPDTYKPSCEANCNTIRLNSNGGTAGRITTLYKLTDSTTWYTDSACTTEYTTTTDVIPTRSGYTFRGFYSATLADATSDTDDGTQYIDKKGAITADGNFVMSVMVRNIYAAWAQNCTSVTNGSCSLDVSTGGVVDYTDRCDIGYTISGDNTYNPVCNANTITINYNNGGHGTTPASTTCVYDQTFDLPAALTEPGYAFDNWTVANNEFDAEETIACTEANLGVSSGATTITATWNFDPKFTIITTNMTANDTFRFYTYAKGTFIVDWGDGTVDTYTVSTVSKRAIEHTYTTAGVHNIRVGGIATEYSPEGSQAGSAPSVVNPAIFFYNAGGGNIGTPTKVAQVTGSIGAVFPTLGSATNQIPKFTRIFDGATNLTSVSSTLFNGATGAIPRMFMGAFKNCSSLTEIPSGLFDGVSGAAYSMFGSTFEGCSSLTSIPSGLFDGVTGAAEKLFVDTFYNCTNLTTIPSGLFRNVSGGATEMFIYTFSDCPRLASIPAGLFNGVTTAAENIFAGTFMNDVALTSVPNGLFANVSGGAPGAFWATFYGCSGLQSIPSNLFAGIDTAAENIFAWVFYGATSLGSIPSGLFANVSGGAVHAFTGIFSGCTGLTGTIPGDLFESVTDAEDGEFEEAFDGASGLSGYVPPELFAGLNGETAESLMENVFRGTGLAETCPCGTHQFITGYEDDWSNKVSCEIGVKDNEVWYNNQCVILCDTGITSLKTSGGLSLAVLKEPQTTPTLSIKYNNQVCYVPVETGNISGTINFKHNNSRYHAVGATQTPPANWNPQP